MITERELKDKCTLEFIKWMCELAEGFYYKNNKIGFKTHFGVIENVNDKIRNETLMITELFPILIHRAVEGWNKLNYDFQMKFVGFQIDSVTRYVKPKTTRRYIFNEYKTQFLIQSECAMLHCLQDIFSEQI